MLNRDQSSLDGVADTLFCDAVSRYFEAGFGRFFDDEADIISRSSHLTCECS
jgi:hypothetical protein